MTEIPDHFAIWTDRHSGTQDDLLSPHFEAGAGKVHDWRNHVGDAVQSMWSTFSLQQRAAIALDASDRAMNEEWD